MLLQNQFVDISFSWSVIGSVIYSLESESRNLNIFISSPSCLWEAKFQRHEKCKYRHRRHTLIVLMWELWNDKALPCSGWMKCRDGCMIAVVLACLQIYGSEIKETKGTVRRKKRCQPELMLDGCVPLS